MRRLVWDDGLFARGGGHLVAPAPARLERQKMVLKIQPRKRITGQYSENYIDMTLQMTAYHIERMNARMI